MSFSVALVAIVTTLTIPVRVDVGAAVPQGVITATLRETNAIWARMRIRFERRFSDADDRTLRVVIDDTFPSIGDDTFPSIDLDAETCLGWIEFTGSEASLTIHLSYGNTVALLSQTHRSGADVAILGWGLPRMPAGMIKTILGRALARVLAHELVHLLLSSKEHRATGLMRRQWSTMDLFSPQSLAFDYQIDATQKTALLAAALARKWH
jgi:hypothetical protein